nr:MAG TPA: hypothetical protein [Caudoviricetes sp.]
MTCTLGYPYPNYFLWFLSIKTISYKLAPLSSMPFPASL